MGTAEVGRELGDASGPLPVATAATRATGYAVLAILLAAASITILLAATLRGRRPAVNADALGNYLKEIALIDHVETLGTGAPEAAPER